MEVDDLVLLRARVQTVGVRVLAEYHEIPGALAFDIADPDGNPIQLVQRGLKLSDVH
jgi:predicted enzyme related to lactoylglutathione lyase